MQNIGKSAVRLGLREIYSDCFFKKKIKRREMAEIRCTTGVAGNLQ